MSAAATATVSDSNNKNNNNNSSSAANQSSLYRARKCLLIGNNAYSDDIGTLDCCCNDAEEMRSQLWLLGFECTLLLDATRRQMTDAIATFLKSLTRNDIALFYFAGHGAEHNGSSYLLPVDYSESHYTDTAASYRDCAVSLDHIFSDLHYLNLNLINIILLDCCRYDSNNRTFNRGTRAHSLQRTVNTFTVTRPQYGHFFIAYACDPGTVAAESDRNGMFTACLLPFLIEPGLLLEQIVKRALKELEVHSKGKQRGWIEMTVHDDIVLCERHPICAANIKSKKWKRVDEWTLPTVRTLHEFQHHKGERCAEPSDTCSSSQADEESSRDRKRTSFCRGITHTRVFQDRLYVLVCYHIRGPYPYYLDLVHTLLIYDLSTHRCCYDELLHSPFGGRSDFIRSFFVTNDRIYVHWIHSVPPQKIVVYTREIGSDGKLQQLYKWSLPYACTCD